MIGGLCGAERGRRRRRRRRIETLEGGEERGGERRRGNAREGGADAGTGRGNAVRRGRVLAGEFGARWRERRRPRRARVVEDAPRRMQRSFTWYWFMGL